MQDETIEQTGTVRLLGGKYEGSSKSYAQGMTYNVVMGHHELVLFHRDPGEVEIREFNRAPVQAALWHDPPALWIAVKFGNINWSDAPYNAGLTPKEYGRHQPLERPEERYPITMLYVDAWNGTIKAIRVATMSPGMSREFLRIAGEQLAQKTDPAEYERSIKGTMRRLTSAQIARRAHWTETLGAP